MKHFVQRLEEYSENPEAKATGAVATVGISLCHEVVCNLLSAVGSLDQLGPVVTSCVICYANMHLLRQAHEFLTI